MFELTSEGMTLLDPQTGRFVAVNPAMCALLSYSEEEFSSLSPEDITPEEAKKIMRASMKTLMEGGDVPDHEEMNLRKDGSKMLARVFMNLIGNSINYIGEGPVKRIRIGWERRDGETVFSVKDTGIGIPAAARETLFNKFVRGSNAAGVSGTGLGLSIVKGIVEAHGGRVWFESAAGAGTAFFFTLGSNDRT